MRKATQGKVFLSQKLFFLERNCVFVVSQVFFAQRLFEYKLDATLQIKMDYK